MLSEESQLMKWVGIFQVGIFFFFGGGGSGGGGRFPEGSLMGGNFPGGNLSGRNFPIVEHFCKNSNQLLAVNYFCKKAPS